MPNVGHAEQIRDADAKHFLVLETVEDRFEVVGPAAKLGEFGSQFLGGSRAVHHERIEKLVGHAGIVRENAGQERAAGAKVHIELEARGVGAEQFPEHGLGTERSRDAFEIREGFVRVRSLGNGSKQSRRDRREEVPAPAIRKKRHGLAGQLNQVLVRLPDIAEAISREYALHRGFVRFGVEDQIRFGLGCTVCIGERLVQQVVQHGAVDRGLIVEILQKLIERIDEQIASVQRGKRGFVQRRPLLRR